MKLLVSKMSQNRRWGIQIVSRDETLQSDLSMYKGTIRDLGTKDNIQVLEIVPRENSFVVIGDDLEPVVGCNVVAYTSLQGYASVTVLVASLGAIWKHYGYKRRDKKYEGISHSGEYHYVIYTGVLVAAGVVKVDKPPKDPNPVCAEETPEQILQAWENAPY